MKTIKVTKTFLPPQNDYIKLLKEVWDSNHLTNAGPKLLKLETELNNYLKTKYIHLVGNGTLALQIAIKSLDLSGEIITTPFSYVATTSSIVWQGCDPVYADIDPKTFCIDPLDIEKKITKKTTAILATHVYGNACEIEQIERIAKEHNLKVIYDAAHCFGVTYKNKSIYSYGDVSVASFHATKTFHTAEGGALFTNNSKISKKISLTMNFGHDGEEKFSGVGINAKMNELQASMGLAVLPYQKNLLKLRKNIVTKYMKILQNSNVRFLNLNPKINWNYAYFPVIFESENELLLAKKNLEINNIFPRRYFFPSLNTLDYVKFQKCPISESISKRILCLPLCYDLKNQDINEICKIINQ